MKKISYNCHKCEKENTVPIGDMLTIGMGQGGISAGEIGFGLGGAMFGTGGGFTGFPGFPGGRQLPKQITHSCTHCKAKNVLTI